MLYCKKCGVRVDGAPNYCPLCQGELSGRPEEGSAYPRILKKPDLLARKIKIAAIISIAAVCICAAVNYAMSNSFGGWWLYTAGAAASFWLSFGVAVSRRANVAKSIMLTTLVVCVLAILWDICTGFRGWSLDYVLPITCCAAMLSMAVIGRVFNLHISQYLYYIILDIVFGIVPIVLVLCGAVRVTLPSLVCFTASVLSLAALFLFNGKAMRAEIVRRTHM